MLDSKTLAVVLAVVLICCFAVGGTFAWLTAETEPVVNTFTYGDINITLAESDTGDNDGNPNTNEYIMVPGNTIIKDPRITVQANSEASWLFVKLEKSDNFDAFMEYELSDGWTLLDGEEGVYYREVSKSSDTQELGVILNDTVTVKGEGVTKEMLNGLTNETLPTMVITAYAVQKDNIDTAEDAWVLIKAA